MTQIVASVVSHLKELEKTMRLEPSGFKLEDVDNCDKLAELLQQLELEVKDLHDELETETIKSSDYRHKLTFFNKDMSKEINENTQAARESNNEVITDLKEKLSELTKCIQTLHKRDKQLSEEINIMKPEKSALEKKHEDYIQSLNEYMAQKAVCQIKLNETRDTLRETNSHTIELEEDMLVLKEALVNEKLIARNEKLILEEETNKTRSKYLKQEEFNEIKEREVQELRKRLDQTDKLLRTIYRENERLEHQVGEVTAELNQGTELLEADNKDLADTHLEELRLANLEAATIQDYNRDKAEMINKTKEAGERSVFEADNLKKLKIIQDIKRDELRKVYDHYKQIQDAIESLRKAIDAMKAEIGDKLKEMAEIEAKNQQVYESLSEAQESHNQVMDSLQREAEEIREQLVFERDLKLKTQSERDKMQLELEAFNANAIAFQSQSAKYLTQTRQRNLDLQAKEKVFNASIEKNRTEKDRLVSELDKAIAKYKQMKERLENELERLSKEISLYFKETTIFNKEINEISPGYEKLCQHFSVTCADFEETKKLLASVKGKKSYLEQMIAQTKEKVIQYGESRERLKTALASRRRDTIANLTENSTEIKSIESKILEIGLKVQTVHEENKKFKSAIETFEVDYTSIDLFMVDNDTIDQKLQDEYLRIVGEIVQGWKDDDEMKEAYANEDFRLIERTSKFIKHTKLRENSIRSLSESLYSEIKDFSNFFQHMANDEYEKDSKKNQKFL